MKLRLCNTRIKQSMGATEKLPKLNLFNFIGIILYTIYEYIYIYIYNV
jgi:hypothetical protein